MKAGKIVKRLFSFVFILILLIVAAAFAIPYFFKDQLLERVKTDINKSVDAKVDFKDVDLSLFRSFPDFSFDMEAFEVIGVDEFEGIKLMGADKLEISLDLMSVIKNERPMKIHQVHLEKPVIHIINLPNGKSNYMIAKGESTEEASTESTSFQVQLQSYSITEGHIIYDDRLGNMFVELKDLEHEGKGDFTQDVFDLVTKTEIGSFTTTFEGVSYLNKVNTELDMTLLADMKTSKFTLKDNELRMNAMNIKADGWVQTEWDKINMDLTFSTPMNQFKNLLSLIPNAYTKDFKDVKADGLFTFNGYVKGAYNMGKGTYPPFKFDLSIDKAKIQYPDLPIAINGINTKVSINSPSSDFNDMIIDIPVFNMQMGNNPLAGKLKLKTPISDPNIDTELKGTINLADLSKAFPMEGVKELNGVIESDIVAKARMSQIDKGVYEEVDMKGNMRITNMNYNAAGMPPVKIKDMQLGLSPQKAELDRFDALLGSSDIQASGTIDNILAYFSPEKTMKGSMKIRSDYFNADEWMPAESASAEEVATVETTEPVEVFDRFDFVLDAKVGKIKYDVYELNANSLVGRMNSNEISIKDFRMKIGESDLKGKGELSNVMNYVFKNETLHGDLKLVSDYFDLNPFMVEAEPEGVAAKSTANDEGLEPFLVPENVDVNLDANFGKLRYTNIDLKNINGNLKVKDKAVTINNTTADMMGGRVKIDGAYDTKDVDKPSFDMTYDVMKFKFKTAYEKLNSIKALAPIAKFIDGQFNTKMSFKGILGKDMMPDLNTLDAEGFLYTFNSVIRNFEPLEKLSNSLDIGALKSWNIKDSKNWFEVKEGKVVIKDFDYKYQGIDMVIGGSHGFSQEMDYHIQAKIPRKMLNTNAVGQTANKGFSMLSKEANKLGLNIKDAEFINVKIGMSGSITNPKISIKPVGTDGKSLKEEALDKLNEKKDEVVNEVKSVVEEQKKEIVNEGKEVVNKAKEDIKKEGKNAVDSILADPSKTTETVKDIVDKAKNPDSLKNTILDKKDDIKDSAKKGAEKLKGLFGKKKKKN